MSDQQPPQDLPRDPMAVSATGAFPGIAPLVAVTADGKVVVSAELLAVARKR